MLQGNSNCCRLVDSHGSDRVKDATYHTYHVPLHYYVFFTLPVINFVEVKFKPISVLFLNQSGVYIEFINYIICLHWFFRYFVVSWPCSSDIHLPCYFMMHNIRIPKSENIKAGFSLVHLKSCDYVIVFFLLSKKLLC